MSEPGMDGVDGHPVSEQTGDYGYGEPTLCDAQIRPFPNAVIVMCERPDGHGPTHAGALLDYAYPGSKTVIQWQESDRRTFRGDWTDCDSPDCILPSGHRGRHAT